MTPLILVGIVIWFAFWGACLMIVLLDIGYDHSDGRRPRPPGFPPLRSIRRDDGTEEI